MAKRRIDYQAITAAGGISKGHRTGAHENPDRVKRACIERQRRVCIGYRVNPTCQVDIHDRHELIPRGVGGKITLDNCVGVCRQCHGEAQARVGGNRLVFVWPGKDHGLPPRASEPGNVRPFWHGPRTGPDERRRAAA